MLANLATLLEMADPTLSIVLCLSNRLFSSALTALASNRRLREALSSGLMLSDALH